MWPMLATAIARARPPATGTARDPYGAPATGRDKAAATAVLVMARTSTNVPAASATAARARLRSSWWPCRNPTALLLAVRCPDPRAHADCFHDHHSAGSRPLVGRSVRGRQRSGRERSRPSATAPRRSGGPACRGRLAAQPAAARQLSGAAGNQLTARLIQAPPASAAASVEVVPFGWRPLPPLRMTVVTRPGCGDHGQSRCSSG